VRELGESVASEYSCAKIELKFGSVICAGEYVLLSSVRDTGGRLRSAGLWEPWKVGGEGRWSSIFAHLR
jgi:hypothetical protein